MSYAFLNTKYKQHPSRYDVEHREGWKELIADTPYLTFNPEWRVRIIPPFCGAMVRFTINEDISIYLDSLNALGIVGKPYWEVYCDAQMEKGPERFLLDETDQILVLIDSLVKGTYATSTSD